MVKYPHYLSKLISFLRKLPGIGFKTAEKLAFELLSWDDEKLKALGNVFHETQTTRSHCSQCFCLKESSLTDCDFCSQERDASILCVVAAQKDVFFLERSHIFKGHYHVLGSLFSPITGKHVDIQRISILKQRIEILSPKEIILALDATLEGDATALFLKQELEALSFKGTISRLALGLPVGLSFDYIDTGTLARAFSGRSLY
ncbi:recombination mediator RecR [Chlamydia sp. 17-3921]|uniref:recombination mediator RecR n=1 Tax=Chlamydia sp. 17-3921 TaxID=2675798 RepID=UPI001919FF83|nr:recombination mediator RecR [Chlamydia sp. 17-3921]